MPGDVSVEDEQVDVTVLGSRGDGLGALDVEVIEDRLRSGCVRATSVVHDDSRSSLRHSNSQVSS